MKIFLYVSLLLLTSCSANKEAKIYEKYVKSSFIPYTIYGITIPLLYTCHSAKFIRTLTYEDSLEQTLKPYVFDIPSKNHELFITSFNDSALYYDSVSKRKYDSLCTTEKDYIKTDGEYIDVSGLNKLRSEIETDKKHSLKCKALFDKCVFYCNRIDKPVGQLYVCRGIITIGSTMYGKIDTVLYSPDTSRIIKVLNN